MNTDRLLAFADAPEAMGDELDDATQALVIRVAQAAIEHCIYIADRVPGGKLSATVIGEYFGDDMEAHGSAFEALHSGIWTVEVKAAGR